MTTNTYTTAIETSWGDIFLIRDEKPDDNLGGINPVYFGVAAKRVKGGFIRHPKKGGKETMLRKAGTKIVGRVVQ